MNKIERQPHAALALGGRWRKAEKIKHLLEAESPIRPMSHLLEIGTGAGGIAYYFACLADPRCQVDAVDVVDQRQINEGYNFQAVVGTTLPFDEQQFDIVISNHVIEHVGEKAAQMDHLSEVARVLKKGGVAYLAVPSRWQIVEPHYHIAFLSWFPRAWRSAYLRLRRRGMAYDCEPLSMIELESMFSVANLSYKNAFVPALRFFQKMERPRSILSRLMSPMPDRLFERLKSLSPTHVYILRHAGASA